MLYLYLLRHAKASSNTSDKLRSLDQSGIEQAKAVGIHLNSYPIIDQVKVSDAKRTLQTLDNMLTTLKQPPSDIEKSAKLYNATAEDIASEIINTQDNVKNLLIIGHNPGILIATQQLNVQIDAKWIPRLIEDQATAKLTIIKSESDSWENLLKFKNKIIDIYWPKQ